jgi:phospholipid/cholesterol/gamma-HCH transport system substrate-binding protein
MFKTDLAQLINNLIEITGDVKLLTSKTRSEEGKKTLELMYKLLWRLDPLDHDAIQKFFQKEGIRTRLF